MSVQISYDHTIDDPPDPFSVERPGQTFSHSICYGNWWHSALRFSPGRIRTAVSSGGRYKLYDGHIETLRNVVAWARSQQLDMRLTYSLHSNLGGRVYNTYPIYALELQYVADDPADKIFFGLNHCRFPTGEFVRGKLPSRVSYRTLLASIFQSQPQFLIHLPFNNVFDITGGYWPRKVGKEEVPYFGPYLGLGLYAFWSTFANRKWSNVSITSPAANSTAGVNGNEWLGFYRQWYKTDDRYANY